MSDYIVVRGGGGGAATGLGALLPAGVVAVEASDDVAPDALLAGEPELIARAVPSRQLEFARGRSCARRALAALGVAPVPILADNRAPIWPAAVRGSITHCAGYCAAAVADVSAWTALGIDAELLRPMATGVVRQIISDAERPELARLEQLDASLPWACVVFSAKEALYKAWWPRARRWLDFHDVVVRLDAATGQFEADVLPAEPGWPRTVIGRFGFDRDRVIATVAF